MKIIREKVLQGFFYLCLAWIIFALGFQTYFTYLHFSGQDEKVSMISNKIMWKLDGRFKESPDNIWYEDKK
jgi:hypothetical protein